MYFIRKNKAFTLIELLVVIAIISILTAIVIANLTQSKAKSRDAKRISDVAQIQLALELFFDRCNQYPVPLSTSSANGCTNGITLGTFMTQIPNPPRSSDPAYSAGYWVNSQSAPSNYLMKVTLEGTNSALVDSYTGTLNSGGTYYQNGSPTTHNLIGGCSTASFEYCVLPK